MDSSVELDEVGQRFEDFWNFQHPDPIRQFLADEGIAETPIVLRLLLEIDIERRRQAGGTIREEDYRKRFPASESVMRAAFANCLRRVREAELEATVLESSADDESTLREPDLSRPEQIGHFLLGKQLGKGGMGTVFEATQVEPFRRQVALKLIRPGLDSRTDLARFQSERQALALMDHPNIARVYEAGVSRDQPFLAMELVQGVPITEYCDRRKLTIPGRLELFIQTCRAVQHAHTKGVIHRDIKPSNVLVTEVEGKPLVKVIDFGLARAFGEDVRLVDETITADVGAIAGTLAYMSPEQTQPQSIDIDTRSDVYSLGALLYELLTGSTPISRAEVKSMALSEVLKAICDRDAVIPSQRALSSGESDTVACSRRSSSGRLSSLLRGDLDWITIRALEKERDKRYQSPEQLAADVSRHLQNEPVLAGPPSLLYRARKLVRRNPTTTAAVVLLTFGLIGAGGVLRSMERLEEQRQEETLRADFEESKRKLLQQEKLVRELTSTMALSDNDALEIRLRNIEAAIATSRLSLEQQADLQFYQFDLLRSVQQFSDAAEVLSDIKPQSDRQRANLLYRKFVISDSTKERTGLKVALEKSTSALSRADSKFLAALEIREPRQRIPRLFEILEQAPEHLDCRHQLMLSLVLTGQTQDVYELAKTTQLLFPDDPSPSFYRGFAAAFAGNQEDLESCIDDLASVMTKEERVPVAGVLQTLSKIPEDLIGLEYSTPSTGDILSLLTEMMAHAQAIENESAVLKSLGRQVSLGVNATAMKIPATSMIMSRFAVISGQLLLGVTSGLEQLLDEVEESGPIPDDAFFSLARGLLMAGKEDPAAAVPFLQAAVQAPSVFPVVSSEACWILNLSARGRYMKTKTQQDLQIAADSLSLWLERDPHWNPGRLRVAFDTALAIHDHALARRLLDDAQRSIPDAQPDFRECRIRLLFSERAFVPVIELAQEVLADPTWESHERLRQLAEEYRDKAYAELRTIAAPANVGSSPTPSKQLDDETPDP